MFLNQKDRAQNTGETLGARIVSAREAQSLTTAQAARRLGVASSTLRDWETGRVLPRSNRLTMLAGLLNVSPTWLLMGRGESPSDLLGESELERLRVTVQKLRDAAVAIADELRRLDERLSSCRSYRN